ncbi:amino acid/polyamine transporter I [Jimgerdemannia flammicorona]|uniref:Amino acid/polyamine transporter I n=1 Tax=Jimgerdemannia flammicorona TaxID=994334 RepID=A0A433DJC7_9FUNG|nr:amino acid/polyamine transporter I [Jimgerdemannia flammicorona]
MDPAELRLRELGLAFTNIGIFSGMSATLQSSPLAMFWGWNIVAFFMICVALSLSEICSAYPTSGGVYFWAFQLAGNRRGPFVAFFTGWIYAIGNVIGAGAVDLSVSLVITSMISIATNNSYIPGPLTTVAICWLVLFSHGVVNVLGARVISGLNQLNVWWTSVGLLVVTSTLLIATPKLNGPEFVFWHYENHSGWNSETYVVLLGLLQGAYTLVGCESAAQINEETKRADTASPVAITMSMVTSWVLGLVYLFGLLFSVQSIQGISDTNYRMPIAQLFMDSVGRETTLLLLAILAFAQYTTGATSITVSSRLMYALARDGACPYKKSFSRLNGFKIPDTGVWMSVVVGLMVTVPYVASPYIFHAIISASTVTSNITYAILLCARVFSPSHMPRGPWTLGRFSLPINIIALLWTIFASILFLLPPEYPITAESMNYAIVAVATVVLVTLATWFTWGHAVYHGPIKQIDLVDPARAAADKAAIEAVVAAAGERGRHEDEELDPELGEGALKLGG